MPGASISEVVDDSNYKAIIKVKIGPVTANFKGDVHVKECNASTHIMVIEGKGGDIKGTSKATLNLDVEIVSMGTASSEIKAKSVVGITGKLASFGGRMMNDITDRLLAQFSKNITELIEAEAAGIEYTQQDKAMNGLAMVFDIIVSWIKNLFSPAKNH